MLSRHTATLRASVVISELPALRRMPAPTPLPTLARPGLAEQVAAWLAARRETPRAQRHSAQVVFLRA